MASCSISRYSFALSLLIVYLFVPLLADSTPSFTFQNFGKDPNFGSLLGLYGDANVDVKGSFIQITGSKKSTAGKIVCKKPIKLFDKNPKKTASFSSYFSFSLSPEAGDGLAFVMLPSDFGSFGLNDTAPFGLVGVSIEGKFGGFAVEFDTKMDEKYGDVNANHVGIDVGSLMSVKAKDTSHVSLVLNSGVKLQSWIDYEASSKRLELRLSRLGTQRPSNPLLSCPIDLSELFKNQNVHIGLSSSNSNSTQISKLYSWSFTVRPSPYWMHSQPLDPRVVSKDTKPMNVSSVVHKRSSDCVLTVLTALVFGIACGALGALIVLGVWSFCTRRQPEEIAAVHPVQFDYDKIKVLVLDDKVGRDVK